MRLSIIAVVLSIGVLALFGAPARAHDGTIDLTFTDWAQQTGDHFDADPWKGWIDVTVQNSSTNVWGDFHFEICGATNVYFEMDPPPLVSSQSPTTWVIGTNPGGYSTLDAYFYDDPVMPGEIATFQIYTNNTAAQNAWFGVCMWPTPVPEPASLVLLALGALLLRRR
ncbi:MAG: PEP-CTERM sorting domain-containing protein [Planctomycetes bacterium]|nr:PEP-CTERM sorting domain-containing protein [Planctomycetota bacterium]